MTAHDAVTRVSIEIIGLLRPNKKNINNRTNFAVGVILLALINVIVIASFGANMGKLVALATFVSFVVAPIIGYMNLKNVMSKDIPLQHQPNNGLRILTYLGILFLSCFSLYYFYVVIF
jgi:Mn2+/Fe2+ NRAMP family transporter